MGLSFQHLDLTKLQKLAQFCARQADKALLISLKGDLGAGKTSFARAFIQAISDDPKLVVPSPTFAILQPFELPNHAQLNGVLHIDFYRLSHPEEVVELGLDAYRESWVIMAEWLENAGDALGVPDIEITLEQAQDPDQRNVEFIAFTQAGQEYLQHVSQHDAGL